MSVILTPDQIRKENVWKEIKSILKVNNLNLAPKVSITPGGISFELDLIDIKAPVGLPSGSGGVSNG
jgi:hypothetical protein